MYILEVFDILNKNGILFVIPLSTYFPLRMSIIRDSGAHRLRMWALDRPPRYASHLHLATYIVLLVTSPLHGSVTLSAKLPK